MQVNSIKSKLSNCGKPGTNGATVRDTNNWWWQRRWQRCLLWRWIYRKRWHVLSVSIIFTITIVIMLRKPTFRQLWIVWLTHQSMEELTRWYNDPHRKIKHYFWWTFIILNLVKTFDGDGHLFQHSKWEVWCKWKTLTFIKINSNINMIINHPLQNWKKERFRVWCES